MSGATLLYDRKLPFNFRYSDKNDVYETCNSMELINVKIFTWSKGGKCSKLKIELSSDKDLFFYYAHYV